VLNEAVERREKREKLREREKILKNLNIVL
jgi:hypothetical protein